jgi:hypothetical protein
MSSAIVHPTHTNTRVKKKAGDPHSRKVKIVCGRCNNGCMGRLQEQAKSLLIPLINGQPAFLDRGAQTTLSAWISMLAMAADLVEPDKSVISKSEHQWLYSKRTAPLNWAIWIGDYKREAWKGHMVHNAMALSNLEHVPEIDEDGVARQNTQATTFVVGRIYAHVVSSVFASVPRKIRLHSPGVLKLRRIWYPSLSPHAWPPPTLSDAEADAISDEFFNRVRSRMVQGG